MLGKVSRDDRPAAAVEPVLPDPQRIIPVSDFPLVSTRRFDREPLSPQQFLHREILTKRGPVQIEVERYLERHIGDRDDQVSGAARSEGRQDRPDALPIDVFERFAAQDRVIAGDLVAAQLADVSFKMRHVRIGERARHPVESVNIVPDIDQKAGDQPEGRSDFQDLLAIDRAEQMKLHPLLHDSLA